MQVANTFAATTTPAGVGGLALSTRFLQKGGLGALRATTAVALQQSVQVITNQLIEDQGARDVTDLYRNVAGISLFSYSGVTFRGFRQDNAFYDGLRGNPFTGFSVPQLFTPPSAAQVTGRLAVTRSAEAQGHATATYEHELFAGALARKRMLPYRARIRARRMEEFDGWVRHDGEEFLYVLTGIVRLYTEFWEPVDLRRGDSAYYDATMGHNLVSLSEEDATVLWVTSLG